VRFGFALAHLHTAQWVEAAVLGDELGYESVWSPDHLVFPLDMSGSLYADGSSAGVPPSTPLHDYPAYLSFLAARTSRIRLGTLVHLFALRHPFVSARAFATLDRVSGGRALCGVGAGWLGAEFTAAGLPFAGRGARLDEALAVARRLWTEEVVEHHGDCYDFGPVMFEPKPVQQPLPVLVGGESKAALARAARHEGWLSMPQDSFEAAVAPIAELRRLRGDRRGPFSIGVCTLDPDVGPDDVARWADAGVDRLIVKPWTRTREALDGLRRFAERVGLDPAAPLEPDPGARA
jgi:probable F420-dependent oxidoreductase